ncbi:MAG TPA: ABC transporter ATP-binding protein [Planctomycetes bacterium]|nr:ABC transporter ATP-binding protein [Planctomycetota bacterium]HIK59979.1 ABC transporter ATP-binding protein [Planctomycetota bacterium]
MLSGRGIRRAFPVGERSLEILHGVDLELGRGQRISLMGASGAGKTTLLNILGLLDRPTEGEVWLDGLSAWTLTTPERAQLRNTSIGFVFQFYHLLAELNALENALLPAMIALPHVAYRHKREEYEGKAVAMLERFGLGDRLKHRPGQLSGGEQQRVAIARALLLDPPLIIADEPTGNLDSSTGERVLELLFDEQETRNTALLLVTHDRRLAQRCERMVHMEDGLIQADSTLTIPT